MASRADEGIVEEFSFEQVFRRHLRGAIRIGSNLAQLGKRIARLKLRFGKIKGDRGKPAIKDGSDDLGRGDAGNYACATPMLHLRHDLLKIAGCNIERPWTVEAGVTHDPPQKPAAVVARRFDEQRNSRIVMLGHQKSPNQD